LPLPLSLILYSILRASPFIECSGPVYCNSTLSRPVQPQPSESAQPLAHTVPPLPRTVPSFALLIDGPQSQWVILRSIGACQPQTTRQARRSGLAEAVVRPDIRSYTALLPRTLDPGMRWLQSCVHHVKTTQNGVLLLCHVGCALQRAVRSTRSSNTRLPRRRRSTTAAPQIGMSSRTRQT
jgi:hypothetical protein